jgi:hypothetical protein
VSRPLVLALVAGAALLVGVAPARATNECRGLVVCVPVAGPWVVVPTRQGVPRPRVEYQLSCPRGYVVGGLDAELSRRRIDVEFLGRLGSPVNPGITTSRAVVFVATYVGPAARAPTFRPHIGCLPASGGGRVPTAVAVVAPGRPAERRVRGVRLVAGRTQRIRQGCGAGERLVGASHAVGFFTRRPPAAELVRDVVARRAVRGGRVVVTARAGAEIRGVRAIVQVAALCAGGQ